MKRVLVINDSRFERLILRDMLNRLGYSVKDTDEFISMRQIDVYDPDIIVVNRTMYDISGFDLIDMIKTKNPKYKCYLSSCSPLQRAAIDGSKADGAFQTPIGITELHRLMEGQETVVGELVEEPFVPSLDADNPDMPGKPAITHAGQEVAAGGPSGAGPAVNFCSACGGDIRHEPAYTFCPFCGHHL